MKYFSRDESHENKWDLFLQKAIEKYPRTNDSIIRIDVGLILLIVGCLFNYLCGIISPQDTTPSIHNNDATTRYGSTATDTTAYNTSSNPTKNAQSKIQNINLLNDSLINDTVLNK